MAVVPLADVKAFLNIETAAHDAELAAVVERAEAMIADRCGPLSSVTVTEERVRSGGSLRVTPVISVTSATGPSGEAVTLDDVGSSGVIFTPLSLAYVDVTYQAGRESLPGALETGVLELVRHLWSSQRGGSPRPGAASSPRVGVAVAGAAYTWPIRVTEAIADHLRVGV